MKQRGTPQQEIKHPDGNDLWEKYYAVRYNRFNSRSTEDVRLRGVPYTGIKQLDQAYYHDEVNTFANIDSIFELWRKGVSVRIKDYNDTAEIYTIIHRHLLAWADYLSRAIHTGNAPIKDLVELDQFASVVYDKAVSVFNENERRIGMAANLLGSQKLNFSNILKRSATEAKMMTVGNETIAPAKNREITHPDQLPKRASFQDVFADKIKVVNDWKGVFK